MLQNQIKGENRRIERIKGTKSNERRKSTGRKAESYKNQMKDLLVLVKAPLACYRPSAALTIDGVIHRSYGSSKH